MWIIEPEFCSRKCVAHARLMAKEPCRCTMMTSDQSDQLMRWKILSRRMPALFTRMSTRPKVSSVEATILSALAGSPIESVEAIAAPPFLVISLTTPWAGPASLPQPSSATPMSLTTTLAPSSASISAMARPMPRPAPVTMATLSWTIPAMCSVRFWCLTAPFCEQMACRVKPGLVRPGPRLLALENNMAGRRPAARPHPLGAPADHPQARPPLAGDLDDQPQLGPLLVLGERVALLGRGKAALAGQRQLVEIAELRGLVD